MLFSSSPWVPLVATTPTVEISADPDTVSKLEMNGNNLQVKKGLNSFSLQHKFQDIFFCT